MVFRCSKDIQYTTYNTFIAACVCVVHVRRSVCACMHACMWACGRVLSGVAFACLPMPTCLACVCSCVHCWMESCNRCSVQCVARVPSSSTTYICVHGAHNVLSVCLMCTTVHVCLHSASPPMAASLMHQSDLSHTSC